MAQRLTGEARKRKLRSLVLQDSLVIIALGLMLWVCICTTWIATLPIIDAGKYPMLRQIVLAAGLIEGVFITAGLAALYMHLSRNRERLYVDIVGEELEKR